MPPRADSVSGEGARLGFSETGQPRCLQNLLSHEEETLPAGGINGTGSFHQKDRLWQRRVAWCERQQEDPGGSRAGCSRWRGWPGQKPDSIDREHTVKGAPRHPRPGGVQWGNESRGWRQTSWLEWRARTCREPGKGRKVKILPTLPPTLGKES